MKPVLTRKWTADWQPTQEQEPIILRGATPNLFPDWSLEWLLKHCGDASVPIRRGGNVDYASFSEAVRLIESHPSPEVGFSAEAPYVWDWDFSDVPQIEGTYSLPEFALDDAILEIPISRRPRLLWVFFGGDRSGTELHQDVIAAHAWSAVISGSKEWLFYPPETQFDDVAGHDAFSAAGQEADRKAGRTPWLGRVGPGDLIFVPSRWWHQVRNLEITLAVSGNFINPAIAAPVYEACERLGYRHITHQITESYGYLPDELGASSDAAHSRLGAQA